MTGSSIPWHELVLLCLLRRSRGLTVPEVRQIARTVTGVQHPRLDGYTRAQLGRVLRTLRTDADLERARREWTAR